MSKTPEKEKDQNEEASSSNDPPPGITGSLPIGFGKRTQHDTIQFRVKGSSITASSPPKFISLAEIMNAAHGFQNMALAHEIAIDKDFKLEPFEPPDNSYQKLVKDTMHRAFFDKLREELNSEPPVFKQALVLLEDVKQGLFSILLPRHTKIREVIEEVLDKSFIQHQAENGAIEFKKYSDFVIDLMSKLAAPLRDEMISDITKLTDTVDIFQAILETLEVMKLDLANSLISMVRPYIQAQTVQYEQAKFKEFMEIQEDGLEITRAWLTSHVENDPKPPESDATFLRNLTSRALAKAYLELLEWKEEKPYPETVRMDVSRYADLANSLYRLINSTSILLVSPNCGTGEEAQEFKTRLKNKITILTEEVCNDGDLEKVLPNVAEQVIADTNELLTKLGQPHLDNNIEQIVKGQIEALKNPEHKVRQIVRERTLQFLNAILMCGGGSQQVPIGMSVFHVELTAISATLLRLVMHNKAVYDQYYSEIVAKELDGR